MLIAFQLQISHLHLKVRSASFHIFKVAMDCSGYVDKIYEILVDILDLKAGFPLANFFIGSDFFLKTVKSRIGSSFFYFEKSC